MTTVTRRNFVGLAAVGAALTSCARAPTEGTEGVVLQSLAGDAKPITAEERAARIAKVQGLMQQQKVAALLVEAGSSLDYYTGIRWRRSERTTAALIPAEGKTIVVTPYFEVPSVEESLQIPADIRPWHEDQSPFALIADALAETKPVAAPLAVEATTRAFIIEGVRVADPRRRPIMLGDQLVDACRMVKSPTELALMQTANDITHAAIRHVHGRIEAGMSGSDIQQMMAEATAALGGKNFFALVLLNEASAYPHGTEKPQAIREGSTVLIDTGCNVHGYSSDISRTWVFGEPSARQREVWETVRRGQEIALETAKIGLPVGDVDHAVRAYYEGRGWARDYGLPGTSHRTGHGIGMDVHEPPNLMRADRTPLQAGMCFSDEPGIYIPGEFGVRMEDCWYMTEQGPQLFTPLAKSIDEPI